MKKLDVQVYPNPSKTIVNIERGSDSQGELQLSIYNLQQDLVYQTHLLPNEMGVGIPVESWSPGIYWLKIWDHSGNVANSKLVKLP